MSRLPTEEPQRLARGNQRATVRYRCAPATVGKLYFADDHEFQRAWIINLSKTGVGLVLARPLPVGAFFIVQMRGARGPFEMPAQVVHATRQTQTDWLIGSELIQPLTDEELETLL